MTDRSDRHYLPPTEWRCSRNDCGRDTTCLRRIAHVPRGTPMGDGMAQTPSIWGQCMHYIQAGTVKRPEVSAPAPKPPMEGLS